MKKQIYPIIAILIVLVASAVTAVRAQSTANARAHIPFDFSVNNKTMKAGDYVINRRDDRGSFWSLNSNDRRRSALLLVLGVGTERTSKGKMTFRRYGNKYFLVSVDTTNYQIGLQKSRAERSLIKKLETNSLAMNNEKKEKPEIISIEITM